MTDNIFSLISKISHEAGALAPQKNGGLNFAFRGVAQVTDHLAPLLQKYGVVVIPDIVDITREHRDVGTKTVTWTKLTARYTFYAPDGSNVSTTTAGMAMDFADRADAQAQSVSLRVALLQVFTLPNSSDKEPEVNGEDVMNGIAAERAKASASNAPKAPAGPSLKSLQDAVRALVAGEYTDAKGTVHDKVDPERIEALGLKISGKAAGDASWKRDVRTLQALVAEVTKG